MRQMLKWNLFFCQNQSSHLPYSVRALEFPYFLWHIDPKESLALASHDEVLSSTISYSSRQPWTITFHSSCDNSQVDYAISALFPRIRPFSESHPGQGERAHVLAEAKLSRWTLYIQLSLSFTREHLHHLSSSYALESCPFIDE